MSKRYCIKCEKDGVVFESQVSFRLFEIANRHRQFRNWLRRLFRLKPYRAQIFKRTSEGWKAVNHKVEL